MFDRLPRWAWRLFRFLPPRLAYAIGLGSLAGRAVLLVKTRGRRSGLHRTTALLYDEMDGIYYVGSARGTQADWYQNLLADPNVEVTVGPQHWQGYAEPITEPSEVTWFLEQRLALHPLFMRVILRLAGLGPSPTPDQLEAYAKRRVLVAFHPKPEG